MFTGIVETVGVVRELVIKGSNRTFWISSPISSSFKVDQSISHNGVCLTVEETRGDLHRVTAIDETLKKTSLGAWKSGTLVNLERCLAVGDRLDGHFVQGHVDTAASCIARVEKEGSWEFDIQFPARFAELVIEKGSICIDGISLTAFNAGKDRFTVAIIPYTFEHTTMKNVAAGDTVNLEFDMIGKYILRKIAMSGA
ncbi:MAG TPA: riboflavin synthase [Flavitalea sp.]|nr:riboflavin synthase [Flavitalea sp.]